MKNKTKSGVYLGWTALVLSLVLLFGGSDFAFVYGGVKILDAVSITAIAILLLAIIGIKLSKK